MRGYLVMDLKRKRSQVVNTLEKAAQIVRAEAADIEWWLEETGIWEGENWTVADLVTPGRFRRPQCKRTILDRIEVNYLCVSNPQMRLDAERDEPAEKGQSETSSC